MHDACKSLPNKSLNLYRSLKVRLRNQATDLKKMKNERLKKKKNETVGKYHAWIFKESSLMDLFEANAFVSLCEDF